MANDKPAPQTYEASFLSDYPFDLYQRTRDIRETVEIIAAQTGEEKLKILDVGGFRVDADNRGELLLREFLPQHEIVALDMMEAAAHGYVRGDGTQLPFKDKSFDVVVTSDVYEHVPPEERELFIDNLLRVSAGYVVLGAPFYSERTALAESIVYEYVRKVLHARQEQLKEHIENNLPDPVQLQEMLDKREVVFTLFNSGNLNGWLTMMLVEHYLMSIPETDTLRTQLNRYYNTSFFESDHGGDGYRRVFVMYCGSNNSGRDVLKSIDTHFAAYAESNEYRRLDQQNLDHIQMMLNLEALRSRALLDEKEGIIRHQAAQIAALNNMRSTRVYRLMQFINRFTLSPILFFGRLAAGKLQQVWQVLRGKRKHPLLSISEGAYRRWLNTHDVSKSKDVPDYKPLFTIVTPAYNTPREWLEQSIQSVLDQVYENWELCIVNDGSTEGHIKEVLDRCAAKDQRVRVKHLRRNRGIATATNEALAMASKQSEFIAFMDSDDLLHPMALQEVANILNQNKNADVIYTDEDKLTLEGQRRRPEFKPDWDPDLFLTYNYINHLTVCRTKLVDAVGGFRLKYDWSQDYDLYLRITEKTDKIIHLPKILYHWREVPLSSASKVDIRPEAMAKSIELLTETLQRRGIAGTVKKGLRPGTFKIKKK